MTQPQQTPSPVLMRLAIAGSAALMLAAGGLFYYASVMKPKTHDQQVITVQVGAKACEPMTLTVPAGSYVFEIHNRSDRPVEWEILDGVMVLEERENILPEMKASLKAQLSPGTYAITCGLLSNPRGSLVVTPSDHSAAQAVVKPDMRAFIGAMSEYKVFLIMQSNLMLRAMDRLSAAINSGDLAAARIAYQETRQPYKRIEMIAGRFADLASVIDPLADYLEKRELDPAFVGFHRLEYGLWAQNSTQDLEPVADRLANDLKQLQSRLKTVKLTPDMLLRSAVSFLNQQADGPILAGDNAYAQLDLSDIDAKLQGVAKIDSLFQPLLTKFSDQAVNAAPDLDKAKADLATLMQPDGMPRPYSQVTSTVRSMLADDFRDIATSMQQMLPVLGLE